MTDDKCCLGSLQAERLDHVAVSIRGTRLDKAEDRGVDGLTVNGLSVERGGRLVVSDLSFDVPFGQALLLTGPNGAGKTTLIRALAGLLPAADGEISLADARDDEPLGTQCHYVAHANAAKLELSVRENLQFWLNFLGGADGAEVVAMAEVGLAALADIPVRYLSAGQQRRVAIARLLIARRPVWLLDEPTVSLDAANMARLVTFGNAHLASGGIIIAATHTPLGFEPMIELRLEPVDLLGFGESIWDVSPSQAAS
ncbi:MAG: heme ABC exporter ATP-binding protein CcmA [Hyphomicrobiaceae bacterium]